MMSDLKGGAPTLVFIKSDRALHQFLAALPDSLEFLPCGRQGRDEPDDSRCAQVATCGVASL